MRWFTSLFAVFFLAFAAQASANTCEIKITGNDQIQYNKAKLTVAADCEKMTLTLEHVGKLPARQMGHNWVLAKTSDWKGIAQAGQGAGPENAYLPKNDERVIVHTDIIGGGQSTSITLDLSALQEHGDYTFFCSFPGHWTLMNGKLVIES